MDIDITVVLPLSLVGEGGAQRSGAPGEGSVLAAIIAFRTPPVLFNTSLFQNRDARNP
jgi:hypothetical protein